MTAPVPLRLRCPCGEELVIDTRATEAASADTEDRRSDARIAALEHALQSLCDCVSMPDVDEVRVECDVCGGGMEGHAAMCPVGHALRVLEGGKR